MTGTFHFCLLKGQAQYFAKCSLNKLFRMVLFLWNFLIAFSYFSYGRKSDDNLTSLRYAKFMEAVTTSSSLKIPPIETAIFFHALRIHLQVAQWKLLDVNYSNPLEWGWKTTDDGLEPVKTDLDAAPENLL